MEVSHNTPHLIIPAPTLLVFSKTSVSGEWKWGEHMLPKVSNYAYLGVNFASNGAWDSHVNLKMCVLMVERSQSVA